MNKNQGENGETLSRLQMGASEPNFIYNERDENVSFEPIFCLETSRF